MNFLKETKSDKYQNTKVKRLAKDEIEKAMSIDVLSYLQQYEPSNLMKISHSTWCLKDHDSLKISNGKWHWFSQNIGGHNALDFLMKVRDKDFISAVKKLTEEPIVQIEDNSFEAPREFTLPQVSYKIDKVRNYLNKRGICDEVITYCHNKGWLYETFQGHNCLFVGYNGENPAYGFCRGIEDNIKRDIFGSDKKYSFCMVSEVPSIDVHVFEAAIDAMSYATLLYMNGDKYNNTNLLSLSGIGIMKNENKLPLALDRYLCDNLTKRIYLHLDRDDVGRQASYHIMNMLMDKYEVFNEPPQIGKDVNDYLLYKKTPNYKEMNGDNR